MYINRGKYGWYTTARNRNDKDDKQYVNLFFPKHTEPQDGTEQINPIEWTLTCFKGKVGMTIFKYEVEDNSKMGGDRADIGKDVGIEPNDLPFF